MKLKVQNVGGSLFIRLPLDWIREHRIREIGTVQIREDDRGSLVLSAQEARNDRS